MTLLSENDIKHAALRFLKTHYKYRPRIGDSKAKIDNITQDGIIADGLISFQTDLKKHFEATLEATSYAKKHEVLYKVRQSRLWWDALLMSTLLTTLLFAILYGGKYIYVGASNVVWAITAVLLCVFTFTMLYRLFFRSLRSYREIYAIVQFKLYDANEQWIAVGIDVFENPDDKYLKELKRQCIYYGFGLVVVNKDLGIRQSITPSKTPLDGAKRKKANFTTLEEIDVNKPIKTSWIDQIRNYSNRISSSVGWEREKRFRQPYWMHLSLLLACGTLLGIMFWREAQKTKVQYVDTSSHRYKLLRKKKQLRGENGFYIVEDENIVHQDSTAKDYNLDHTKRYDDEGDVDYNLASQDSIHKHLHPEFSEVKTYDQTNAIVQADIPKPTTTTSEFTTKGIDNTTSTPIETQKTVAQVTKPKPKIDYWCKDYANWKSNRFVLQDGVYSSQQSAEFRLAQINKASAIGGILRGGCLKGKPAKYIVYVSKIYTKESDARADLPKFDILLKDKGYSSGDLFLSKISKK